MRCIYYSFLYRATILELEISSVKHYDSDLQELKGDYLFVNNFECTR